MSLYKRHSPAQEEQKKKRRENIVHGSMEHRFGVRNICTYGLHFQEHLTKCLRSEIHIFSKFYQHRPGINRTVKSGFTWNVSFLSLQIIIATLSSSKLLLKLCLIHKHFCCYLFYIKEYWWKGSSNNRWHKFFGSFLFSNYKQTKSESSSCPKCQGTRWDKHLCLNITRQ